MKTIHTWLLAVVLALALAPGAPAAYFKLQDGNSLAEFDPAPAPGLTEFGLYEWAVDEVEVLHQQWFWYRLDNAAEQPIHTLTMSNAGTTDTDFDGQQDTLVVLYTHQLFDIQVRFTLEGGTLGSGVSDLAEQIRITSKASDPLKLSFFQHVDFDLYDPEGDTVEIVNANTVRQTDGAMMVAETVVTPTPSHHEVAEWPVIVDKLSDDNADDLNDANGPVGPGDVSWGFQWDINLAAGDTYLISKDKNVTIPEPGSFLLTGLGLLALGVLTRRAKSA